MKLQNKVVVIVGGSQGLGKALASSFMAEGARVMLVSKRRMELVQPANDEVVPIRHMLIDGVAVTRVPHETHVNGIARGVWRAPDIFDGTYARNQDIA